jgi:hypothetical protein
MNTVKKLKKDYLVNGIHLQMGTLQDVLFNVENCSLLDEEYVSQSLKSIEKEVKKMRKIYLSN